MVGLAWPGLVCLSKTDHLKDGKETEVLRFEEA